MTSKMFVFVSSARPLFSLVAPFVFAWALSLPVQPAAGQDKSSAEKSVSNKSESKEDQESDKKEDLKVKDSKVDKLFRSMRDLSYTDSATFPKLTWEDIPDLLSHIDRVNQLKRFPSNPLSSQAWLERREGIIAAWLIEGIRAGGKHPSLNPSCYDGEKEVEVSKIASAYKNWWKKVADLKPEKAKDHNPLNGTDFRWR